MIVDLVDDWNTLHNLSNASPFFRNMLIDKRTDFLAPEAIKILASNRILVSASCRSKLRSLCRSWCLGVDLCLEQHNTYAVELYSLFEKKLMYEVLTKCKVYLVLSITCARFINDLKSTHGYPGCIRNPILGRGIEVSMTFMSHLAVEILKTYGRHIWYLKVEQEAEETDVRSLRKILKLLPNLRSLIFENTLGCLPCNQEANAAGNLLPPLKNLVALKARLSFVVQSRILNNNPSIETLELTSEVPYPDLGLACLTYVKHLKLYLNPTFRHLALQTPSLTQLTLHWNYSQYNLQVEKPEDAFVRWKKICCFVNRTWGSVESLTEVELEFPGCYSVLRASRIMTLGASLRLGLKTVKRLRLLLCNPCCLDLLLPIKNSLRWLRVKIQCISYGEVDKNDALKESLDLAKKRQRIQFLGWEHRLLESNIWELFPNLQEVVLEGHLSYDKKEYRYYNHHENQVLQYCRNEWLSLKRK